MNRRGEPAEDAAATFLIRQGLTLVARNYHCRFGEIDLILNDGATLVFVEVRYRRSLTFGSASESITHAKQRKLLRAARHYMAEQSVFPECRFDAVLLNGDSSKIEWLRNAFGE
ncbi:MAG: YraN family protein [Burkholderiales bacterium]